MKPKWSARILGFAFGLTCFFACMTGVGWVSKATHSGMLGICGPYGKHANLVGNLFLASFPISVIAGIGVQRVLRRRHDRNANKSS